MRKGEVLVFCGWLSHQGRKSFEAGVVLELELVMYDRLVLAGLDQSCVGHAWSGVQ